VSAAALGRWAAPVAQALAAANVALFLGYVATARYPIPLFDPLYFLYEALVAPQEIWAQYGEQRPVVMRLLTRLDLAAFAGSEYLFVFVALAALAGIVAVMITLTRRLPGSPALRAVALALAVALCCRCFTLETYVWSHGVQYALAAAAGAAALIVAPLWAAVGLAALATLSYGNGLALWPLLVAVAWLRGAPRSTLVVLVGLALAVVSAYAIGYRAVEDRSDVWSVLARPADLVSYVVHFLGSPWARGGLLDIAGVALGAAVLAVGAWAAIEAVRTRDGFDIACAALIAFAVASALMSGVARLDFGAAQAVQSRYGPCAMLGHAGAALFVLSRAPRTATVAALAFLAVLPVEQVLAGELFRWQARDLADVELALQAGVRDDVTLGRIYPRPDVARATVEAAKARGVSLFRDPDARRVGTGIAMDAPVCEGKIESVGRRDGAAWELTGWARDAATGALPRMVLVADAGGRVVGLGRRDRLRRELPAKFGWRALAVSAAPPAAAVALLPDGGACRILPP
jgi:hypothetical protein